MNEEQSNSLRALAIQRQILVATDWPSKSLVASAILEAVALAFGLAPIEITGRSRHKSVAEARTVFCYIARRCTRMSFPEIGRAINRDHTTVMSAVKRVESRRQSDRWTDSACAVLLEQFGDWAEESKTQ